MSRELSDKQNILYNAAGSLIYLGCQWLLTVLVVRLSDGLEYAGNLALAMSIANIFVPFAQYRMRTIQVSDVSHSFSAGDYLGFRFLTVVAALIGSMIYSYFTCASSALLSIFIYLLYKALELVIDVFHGLDQQNYRMDYVGISFALRGILSVTAFSFALIMNLSLEMALVIMTLVCIPVCLFFDIPKAQQFDTLRPIINKSTVFYFLKIGILPAASLFACSAAMTFPRQMLSSFFGTASLGIYASVASPIAIVQTGASYIYTPLIGRFAEHFSRGDNKSFISLFIKVSLTMLALVAALSLLFSTFGHYFLYLLYGGEVAEHTELLVPMLICSLFTVLLWFANDLLVAMRKVIESFIGNAAAALLALAFSFYFVPNFSMNGVSFTGILGYGLAFVFSLCFIIYTLKSTKGDFR